MDGLNEGDRELYEANLKYNAALLVATVLYGPTEGRRLVDYALDEEISRRLRNEGLDPQKLAREGTLPWTGGVPCAHPGCEETFTAKPNPKGGAPLRYCPKHRTRQSRRTRKKLRQSPTKRVRKPPQGGKQYHGSPAKADPGESGRAYRYRKKREDAGLDLDEAKRLGGLSVASEEVVGDSFDSISDDVQAIARLRKVGKVSAEATAFLARHDVQAAAANNWRSNLGPGQEMDTRIGVAVRKAAEYVLRHVESEWKWVKEGKR